MKQILFSHIVESVASEIKRCLTQIDSGVLELMKKACQTETVATARFALEKLIQNSSIAREENIPACQDCGIAVFFVRVGSEAFVKGGINNALNSAVEIGYQNARKSVCNPLTRANTANNTPPVIYYDYCEDETLEISFMAKGAGSENMSRIYMLSPSAGEQGIIDCAVDCVKTADSNPCPPLVVGVGIGGTFDKAAQISKLALTRTVGAMSQDPDVARLEQRILAAINNTNIGAQGFGGKNTALAVHIETYPTHIGSLPVAINLQCHAARHFKIKF